MVLEQLYVPELAEYDIIVAGGGVSGVAAALAAARAGCKTLLIEKSMMLGGLGTLGLINYIEPLCNGRGRKIIGGICEELLRLSIQDGYDTLPEAWRDAANGTMEDINKDSVRNPENPPRYVTHYSPYLFAMSLTGLLKGEGVDLLYDTLVCKPLTEKGTCLGVIVENKSGRGFYKAKYIVDATGDADIVYRADLPTYTGDNWFSYWGRVMNMDTLKTALETGNISKALQSFSIGSNLYGGGHPEGMKKFDGTDAKDITEYVITAHKMAMEKVKGDDRFKRDIVMIPGMPQFRTTRRIVGEYELKEEDQYVHFEDSIGAICDFTKRDIVYEVPYRCLFNKKCNNLITAGRSISSKGWAWDITRVIPPAILTGQAAGLAASLACRMSVGLDQVPVEQLQEKLADTGVLIHY